MAEIILQGKTVHTIGSLPAVGNQAPNFKFTTTDFEDTELHAFSGKQIILNIFPSIDTEICGNAMKRFNAIAADMHNTVVIGISADLPFAQKRFCGTSCGINVLPGSIFRHHEFGELYGVLIIDGSLAGLLARAVVIINANNEIIYTEQVPEISCEPDYAKIVHIARAE